MKSFLFLIVLFIAFSSTAQFLEDGSYTFTDGGYYSMDIEICDGGWSVCSFNFKHDENTIAFVESGEWFRVNLNGVGDDYDGPIGWYQIYTEEETYEFENLPNGTFKLLRGEDSYILRLKK
ncbi:MAG: hypothetical protein ACK45H_01625 [Bacteroidota bacterium]